MERLKATVVCADMKNSLIFNDFLTMCGYEITKTTQYGFDCVAHIMENRPDVVISDAFIYDFDICTLYEEIKSAGYADNMVFVVVSSVTDSSLINKILNSGIDLFVLMPTDFMILDKRIRELVESKKADSKILTESDDLEFEIRTYLKDIAHELGMSPVMSGYDYVIEAIVSGVLNKFGQRPEMTKIVYPEIAKQFNTTPAAVERAIRSVIEKSWLQGNASYINEIFGYSIDADRGRASNAQFINTLVEKIKTDLKIK